MFFIHSFILIFGCNGRCVCISNRIKLDFSTVFSVVLLVVAISTVSLVMFPPCTPAYAVNFVEETSLPASSQSDFTTFNSLVQVDSDTYALAYSGANNIGTISTFTISADGTTVTQVATLNHNTTPSQYNSLVQVDSDTYALAYGSDGDGGSISTFTISADGLTITEEASLEYDTIQGLYNSLVQVDSDTYALAYSGNSNDGFIATFTISADGTTINKVNTLEHDTALSEYNSFVQVDSDTYALAYLGSGFDGFIKTFTISADGLTITEVNALEHDTSSGTYNSLVQVDSDTYALAYLGSGFDGFIKTFTFDDTRGGSGSKTKPQISDSSSSVLSIGANGFAATFDVDLNDPSSTAVLVPGDRIIFTMDLHEDRGINGIEYISLYLSEQEDNLLNLLESKTYITYESDDILLISDPNGFFSDVSFDIIEVDASNFVLKYDIEFSSTMGLTDMLLYMWNIDRYVGQKFFESAIEVVPIESTLTETEDEFEKEVDDIVIDTTIDTKLTIPDELKYNIHLWAQEELDDVVFANAIEFLIQEKIIDIDRLPNTSKDPDAEEKELEETITHIPKWLHNNVKWWAEDLLSEEEFLKGIKYLVEKEIIRT